MSITKEDHMNKDEQLAAVQKNGMVLAYIEAPDKEVQMAAVRENSDAIRFIRNADPEVEAEAEALRIKKGDDDET